MERIADVSAAILAGGKSRRMGVNKALLPCRGRPMIARIHDAVRDLFEEVFLVTGEPGSYAFLPCPKIPDRMPGKGPISGVDAALRHCRHPYVLVVGCDTPFLSRALIRDLAAKTGGGDLAIPVGPRGPEPLCAIYGKGCLPRIEEMLREGEYRLAALALRVRTREIPREEVAALDPGFRSFLNVNTPEEYRDLAERGE